MSFFTNSNNISISGGVFNSVRGDQNNHHNNQYYRGDHYNYFGAAEGRKGIEILATKIAFGAIHDGAEQAQRPKCHPDTRQAVVTRIMNWIHDKRTQSQFLWIYGPFGAGKSAIARKIAEICQAQHKGRMTGCFFFNRHALGCNDETLLISTLVYQLTQSSPEFRQRVAKVFELHQLILSLSLETQMLTLIVQPLNEMINDGHEIPNLIILDGLNECIEPESQRQILEILSFTAEQIRIPFLFLIFSRPEQTIRDFFNPPKMRSRTTRIILNEDYDANGDIWIYLQSRFHDITLNHPARAYLPTPWPSDADIDHLVKKSSGQFIYAATVIKFIESPHHSPKERLNIALGLAAAPESPFADLDPLYRQIFSAVRKDNIKDVLEVLSILFLAEYVEKSPHAIEQFLSHRPGAVSTILSDLHSAFGLPEEHDEPIRDFHASLIDFLLDPARSGDYYINVKDAHASITRRLLKSIMQNTANSTINSPERHGLLYHCPKSALTSDLLLDLYEFNLKGYLDWMSNILLVRRLTPTIVPKYNLHDIQQFLRWFEYKIHPDYSNDLFQHHLKSIDNWIHGQLSVEGKLLESLSSTSELCFGLKEYALEIFDILGKADSRPSDSVILSILSRRSKSENPLIHQFLSDPARARSFFLSEDDIDYMDLACKVMKYLIKRGLNDDSLHPYQIINSLELEAHGQGSSEVVLSTVSVAAGISKDKSALDLIPLILPKASNGLQLETLLRGHPFAFWDTKHSFYSEKREAAQAAENYLKVYEKLNAILASQGLQSKEGMISDKHSARLWGSLGRRKDAKDTKSRRLW